MKDFFILCKNEIKKLVQMTVSYPLNIAISVITFVGISIAVLFGISSIFHDSLNFYSLLFSPLVFGCISSMSNSYKFDTMIGAVEQVANSRFGLHKVLFARYCIDCVISIVPTAALMLITSLIFDYSLSILWLLLTFVVMFAECYFLGIILLGLVLVFRKVDSVFTIINLVITSSMLAAMVKGVDHLSPLLYIIPFSNIAIMPAFPFSSDRISASSVIMLILNIILSSIMAYFIYHKLYRKSLKLGTIGQY